MALQSKLFQGDQKLEDAANVDARHIAPGARGDHVRKIQVALASLDPIKLAADGSYGPATARAVLAFKKKRDIVNRTYQAEADNIVGRMTMAALDIGMRDLEQSMTVVIEDISCGIADPKRRPFRV